MRRLPTRCLCHGDRQQSNSRRRCYYRRALMCRLDLGIERPDQRQFDFDPRDEASRDRPLLVAAGLTILRASLLLTGNPMEKIGSLRSGISSARCWSGLERKTLPSPAIACLLTPAKGSSARSPASMETGVGWHRQVTLLEQSHLARSPTTRQSGGLSRNSHPIRASTTALIRKALGVFSGKHLDRVVGGLRCKRSATRQHQALRCYLRADRWRDCGRRCAVLKFHLTGAAGFEGFGRFLRASLGWQTCRTVKSSGACGVARYRTAATLKSWQALARIWRQTASEGARTGSSAGKAVCCLRRCRQAPCTERPSGSSLCRVSMASAPLPPESASLMD